MNLRGRIRHIVGSIIGMAGVTIILSGTSGAAGLPGPSDPNNHNVSGRYFSGKGGPTISRLAGVRSMAGHSINKKSAISGIGAFGMAVGYEWMYRYGVPLRTELEFMNRTEVTFNESPHLYGAASGALASTAQNVTTMVKAYWHFPVKSAIWWPFVSAGVGWSHNTLKSVYTPTGSGSMKNSHTSEDLAWSVGGGISVKMGPNMVNDIEIRQVSLGQPNWGLPPDADIKTRSFMGFSATEINFALRFRF